MGAIGALLVAHQVAAKPKREGRALPGGLVTQDVAANGSRAADSTAGRDGY